MATSAPPQAAQAAAPQAAAPQAPAAAPPAAQAAAQAASPYLSTSLYVGDLNADVTEAMLFETFSVVGPIASIRVCRDAVTRRSLGYAYVNFQFPQDAERALDTLNYSLIKGRPCRIMWSRRDPSIRKSGVGNIFIKSLSKDIDNKALYDTFSAFGNILSCHVATDKATSNSKGFAFVHFETKLAADNAIKSVNNMLLNGKKVFVGPFQSRRERDAGLGITERPFTNVYLKDVDPQISEAELKEIFAQFGQVNSCVIMRNEDGRSKGFGFVNFNDTESAKKAIDAVSGKDLKGKVGTACRAQKKEERQAELRKRFEDIKMERMKHQGVNLYIKNLDDSIDDEKLKAEFAQFGTIVSARVMTTDNRGAADQPKKSRGFGFVCFETPEQASKAMTDMNSKVVAGKPLYVGLAQPKEVRQAQLAAQHSYMQGVPVARMEQGAPMMYPPAPPMYYPMPRQHQPGFVGYPQQAPMVARPRWQSQQQQAQPPRYQQQGQPPYAGVPAGRGGRAPQAGPRRQQQPGSPNLPAGQAAPQVKYTTGVRNQQVAAPEIQFGAQIHQEPMPMHASAVHDLTSSALAAAPPHMQKQMLGERLFPLVEAVQPNLAGKITGMLLEMDNGELLHFLESPESLNVKIQEAVDALLKHQQELARGQLQQ